MIENEQDLANIGPFDAWTHTEGAGEMFVQLSTEIASKKVNIMVASAAKLYAVCAEEVETCRS